ncbi:hypothetical protein ABK040_008252 [Willaertia magna]
MSGYYPQTDEAHNNGYYQQYTQPPPNNPTTPAPQVYTTTTVITSTPLTPYKRNQWKTFATISSIITLAIGALLTLDHFIAMIVWYAKSVPSFGTINLWLIPSDILIVLISASGVVSTILPNRTLDFQLMFARIYAYGAVFATGFLFVIYLIHTTLGFFTKLYYDASTALIFLICVIPLGVISGIFAFGYLKTLDEEYREDIIRESNRRVTNDPMIGNVPPVSTTVKAVTTNYSDNIGTYNNNNYQPPNL